MAIEKVDVMIEGGKATAAPPLGPALGPLGVNIGDVVKKINEKTADFKGMQVPVKVAVNSETKEFEITVGTPPASALIKKEAGIKKAAGNPLTEKVADLKIEQIIKISKMKQDALLGKDNVQRAKEIIGTCQSMGVLVEGKPAQETLQDIKKGIHVEKIKAGKTELSQEEKRLQEEEKKRLQEEMEKQRGEFEIKAKEILNSMAGKDVKLIRKRMEDEEIPMPIINEFAPEEKEEEKSGHK